MKKHVEVAGAVIIEDGKVFCAQRHLKGAAGGMWEFPGGKIEPGETPQQTLVREIREELKSEISVGDYLTTVHHEYETVDVTMQVFFCKLVKGDLTLTEHLAKKWVDPQDLMTIAWAPADLPVAELVRKRLVQK